MEKLRWRLQLDTPKKNLWIQNLFSNKILCFTNCSEQKKFPILRTKMITYKHIFQHEISPTPPNRTTQTTHHKDKEAAINHHSERISDTKNPSNDRPQTPLDKDPNGLHMQEDPRQIAAFFTTSGSIEEQRPSAAVVVPSSWLCGSPVVVVVVNGREKVGSKRIRGPLGVDV